MKCRTIKKSYRPIQLYACWPVRYINQMPVIVLLTAIFATAQPAKNANKFLGNITTRAQVRSDFSQYWNHITGETECQWMSVEGTRNKMNWTGPDRIATFAREHKIPWRFHSLLTSGTYPAWMSSIPDTALLRELGEWMDAAALRYPDVTMIDVINEGYLNNLSYVFKNALGGNGVSGFDWAIKAFKMARERWPHALLIYNDYNNIEVEAQIRWTIDLLTALKQANAPIDIIGCEANFAQELSTVTLKKNIDRIAETGLPVYISAYEVGTSIDSVQDSIIREQFTMFWNHPKVIGVTYWGYVLGQTWRSGTGLLTLDSVERPALVWLKNYVKNNPQPPNDFPNLLKLTTDVNYYGISDQKYVSKSPYTDKYGIFDLLGRCGTRLGNISGNDCLQRQPMSSGLYITRVAGNKENAVTVRVENR